MIEKNIFKPGWVVIIVSLVFITGFCILNPRVFTWVRNTPAGTNGIIKGLEKNPNNIRSQMEKAAETGEPGKVVKNSIPMDEEEMDKVTKTEIDEEKGITRITRTDTNEVIILTDNFFNKAIKESLGLDLGVHNSCINVSDGVANGSLQIFYDKDEDDVKRIISLIVPMAFNEFQPDAIVVTALSINPGGHTYEMRITKDEYQANIEKWKNLQYKDVFSLFTEFYQ